MAPYLRKFMLTVHITFSVGWLGAATAYLILAFAALMSQDGQMLRAVYLALEPIGRHAIVPLAIASLLTGLVMSLGTRWGLFQHYWILFKLLLTVFATIVLLEHMSTVSFLTEVATETGKVDSRALRGEILHAAGGLLVLLTATVLAVYKPRAMTPYGLRKRLQKTSPTIIKPPQWVKVFGILLFVFVLLFVFAHITGTGGNHGSGAH